MEDTEFDGMNGMDGITETKKRQEGFGQDSQDWERVRDLSLRILLILLILSNFPLFPFRSFRQNSIPRLTLRLVAVEEEGPARFAEGGQARLPRGDDFLRRPTGLQRDP